MGRGITELVAHELPTVIDRDTGETSVFSAEHGRKLAARSEDLMLENGASTSRYGPSEHPSSGSGPKSGRSASSNHYSHPPRRSDATSAARASLVSSTSTATSWRMAAPSDLAVSRCRGLLDRTEMGQTQAHWYMSRSSHP